MTTSVLVNFPGSISEPFGLVPDNGLAQLAGVLKNAGHSTVIADYATVSTMEVLYPEFAREELEIRSGRILGRLARGETPDETDRMAVWALEDRIDAFQEERIGRIGCSLAAQVKALGADFVGFKLWTGQGFAGSVRMAEEVRRANPGVKIYGGGPHVDWFMEHAARYAPVFDAMAYGEGEDTILGLADCARGKRALESVPGLVTRDGRVNPPAEPIDLDRQPLPLYDPDTYPSMAQEGEKVMVFLVDESRGCPNRCHFCGHPAKSGNRRAMDPVRFVDRLESLQAKHGVRYFRFAGSNPPSRQRALIAGEILKRKLDVRFGGFAHVSGHLQDDYRLLRQSGCRVLSFGVESGSQRILDESINKRVRVEDIRLALTACKQAGIKVVASLIVPAPHETEETKEETFRLIRDIRPDSTMVHIPAAVPGTAWFQHRDRFGFDLPSTSEYARMTMTHRVRPYGNPVLWRPLEMYRMCGKSLSQIGQETSLFMNRLSAEGLPVQIYDSVFLCADAIRTEPETFRNRFEKGQKSGGFHVIRNLVAGIRRANDAPKLEGGSPHCCKGMGRTV